MDTTDWGAIRRKPNRKRKINRISNKNGWTCVAKGYDENQDVDMKQKVSKVIPKPICDVMGSNDQGFVQLQMEFMSDFQLRQIASVSSEWCRMAYSVIRRRIGDRVFSLLWSVPDSAQCIKLLEHFHPSLLRRSKHDSLRMSINSPEFTIKQHGYLNNLVKPSEVQAIVCFADYSMEVELIETDDCGDLPFVDLFLYVIGDAIVFSTPDLKGTGDSQSGLYGCNFLRTKFMSSFCFPKSTHFALNLGTLPVMDAKFPRGDISQTSHVVGCSSWTTKAIIVFKFHDHDNLKAMIQEQLDKAFAQGSMAVTMISGVYLYIGANILKPTLPSTAVTLSIMGDGVVSSTFVEILDMEPNALQGRFYQLSTFINGAGLFHSHKKGFTFFAFLFCYSPSTNNGIPNFSDIRTALTTFRSQFPHVPIQGVCSDSPVNSELFISPHCDMATRLTLEMGKMQCGSDTVDRSRLMVILVVKYPNNDPVSPR